MQCLILFAYLKKPRNMLGILFELFYSCQGFRYPKLSVGRYRSYLRSLVAYGLIRETNEKLGKNPDLI